MSIQLKDKLVFSFPQSSVAQNTGIRRSEQNFIFMLANV